MSLPESTDGWYEYHTPKWKRRFQVVYAIVIASIVVFSLVLGIRRHEISLVLGGIGLPAILSLIALLGRRTARRVRFLPGSRVELSGPGRTIVVDASDLLSLKASAFGLGAAVLRYRNGKLPVITQIDGWHEIVAELKQLNPKMQIRGF